MTDFFLVPENSIKKRRLGGCDLGAACLGVQSAYFRPREHTANVVLGLQILRLFIHEPTEFRWDEGRVVVGKVR